jgi:hypothetical protein
MTPSMARLPPSPPTDFSSQAPLWWQGRCLEPRACREAHQESACILPEHRVWSPLQGEHSNFFRNTFREPHGVTTLHATSHKVVMLHPAQGSREAILSSDNEAPPDVIVHRAKEGVKGGKRRSKQHPQETTTTTTATMRRQAAPV